MTQTILIADDDPGLLTVLSHAVKRKGYTAITADSIDALLELVEDGKGDALITDVCMPDGHMAGNSLDILPRIRRARPDLPVIVISAKASLATAVGANAAGAFDYLPKPFDLDVLLKSLEKSLANKTSVLDTPEPDSVKPAMLVGTSPAMQQIYRTLSRMVATDLTVMVMGESGTGKELVARALHELGKRSHRPFIAVNMAAIPKELVESELFGHEKGAFTSANARRAGTFEQAEGGTLFLDEIGDMPVEAQSKLLRVLQQGEFTTVGGTKPIRANVRIICATHRDLLSQVRLGTFREDLYYRLNVVPLTVPPLRERKEDIALLTEHFLAKAASRGLPPKKLSVAALACLKNYEWPGNVRELENLIFRLCALQPEAKIEADAITALFPAEGSALPASIKSLEERVEEHIMAYFLAHEGGLPPAGLYERTLPLFERPLIKQTLKATFGNQLKAASLLGINRNTLRKRMKELGIEADDK